MKHPHRMCWKGKCSKEELLLGGHNQDFWSRVDRNSAIAQASHTDQCNSHACSLWPIVAKRFKYGDCHIPSQLCPLVLLIFYLVTRVRYDLPTPSMYFPILVLGVEENESSVQLVLWFNGISKHEQTCLSVSYKTWAKSDMSVLLAPQLSTLNPQSVSVVCTLNSLLFWSRKESRVVQEKAWAKF